MVSALVDALSRAATAIVAVACGVVALAALEARVLDPRRGVLGALARALRIAQTAPPPSADHALGVWAAALAVTVPVAAAVLVLGDPATSPVASGLLCLGAAGPLLAAVAAGVDERARLALFDALAATTRRLLVLLACAVAAPVPAASVVVGVVATVELVCARHRGPATLLPRWPDSLAGRFVVLHRVGERATAVAVACGVGVAAQGLLPVSLGEAGAVIAGVAAVVATGLIGVVVAHRRGPQHGEGMGGPLVLLSASAALRVVAALWP
jgi:hypothetical protein